MNFALTVVALCAWAFGGITHDVVAEGMVAVRPGPRRCRPPGRGDL